MGRRYCSIKACQSIQNRVKEHHITTWTLFSVPKAEVKALDLIQLIALYDENLRNRWSQLLNQELRQKDVICESHFYENDIVRYFESKLNDGTIHKIARERPKLKDNTLPMKWSNTLNVPDIQPESVSHIQGKNAVLPASSPQKARSALNTITNSQSVPLVGSCHTENVQCNSPISINISHLVSPKKLSSPIKSASKKLYSNEDLNSNSLIETKEAKSPTKILKCPNENNIQKQVSSANDLRKQNQQSISIYEEKVSNCNQQLLISIYYLLQSKKVGKQWSWSKVDDVDGLTFWNYDLQKFELKFCFTLSLDLKIKFFTADKKISVDVTDNFKITKVQDIIYLLKKFESFKVCRGVSTIDGSSRSNSCKAFVTNVKDVSSKNFRQCSECQILEQRIRSRMCAKSSEECKEVKKNLQNIKRNLHNSKERNTVLNDKIKNLQSQIQLVEKNALVDEIAKLPAALLDYLYAEFNYEYLMTARLDQNELELFFSTMRGSIGSHDHPDPIIFLRMCRLLCIYNIIKPPKGANAVAGEDLLTAMMDLATVMTAREKKEIWYKKLQVLLDYLCTGEQCLAAEEPEDDDIPANPANNKKKDDILSALDARLEEHNYDVVKTSSECQSYLAGYVSRKVQYFVNCSECINLSQSRTPSEQDKFITLMNKGQDEISGLIYPSRSIFELTEKLESNFLSIVCTQSINEYIIHQVLDRVIEKSSSLPLVGCEVHKKTLTVRITDFYLNVRGNFLCKSYNINYNNKRKKTKELRKQSKY